MDLSWTEPVDWVLSALLAGGWMLLWATVGYIPRWFHAVGLALVVVCVPAGIVARRHEFDGNDCAPGDLCFSMQEFHWWVNGFLGFLTAGALALLTMLATAVLLRRSPKQPFGTDSDGHAPTSS